MRTLLVFLLTGCLLPTGLPETAAPFTPPTVYTAWWQRTCECAGATGNVNRIRWATLPDEQDGGFLCERAGAHYPGYCYGVWIEPHTIVMARPFVEVEDAVRHEMLHDLMPRLAHTDPRFFSCVGLPVNRPAVTAPTL